MQSKAEWLKEVYTAFNRREVDAVLACMVKDVDWPNGMEGGRVHGHDEVRAYWQRQWGLIDPNVDPVRIADDAAGDTVVDVHQVVRDLSGKCSRTGCCSTCTPFAAASSNAWRFARRPAQYNCPE